MEDLWEIFLKSGSVADYLRYKSGEEKDVDAERPRAEGEKS